MKFGGPDKELELRYAAIEAAIASGSLPQDNVVRLLEKTVEGVLDSNGELVNLGIKKKFFGIGMDKLLGLVKNPEINRMYENLLIMAQEPSWNGVYAAAISTGAAVASVEKGIIEYGEFNGDRYLDLAKRCLENVARNGMAKMDTRKYAVEAFRNFEDAEARQTVIRILNEARKTRTAPIIRAARESLEYMKLWEEVKKVRAHKKRLTEAEDTEEGLQRIYIDMTLTAVETVLTGMGDKKRSDDVLVAVNQLVISGADPAAMKDMIGEKTMDVVRGDVETALLFALVKGDKRVKEDAKRGLVTIGSERVRGILKNMAQGRTDETAKIAWSALLDIQKKKNPGLPLPPFPKAAPRPKPRLTR